MLITPIHHSPSPKPKSLYIIMQWWRGWKGSCHWLPVLCGSTRFADQDPVATLVPWQTGLNWTSCALNVSAATDSWKAWNEVWIMGCRLPGGLWSTMAWAWLRSGVQATWYPSTSLLKGWRWSTHSFAASSFRHTGDGLIVQQGALGIGSAGLSKHMLQ